MANDADFSALEAELADPLGVGFAPPLSDFALHSLREAFAKTTSRWEEFYEPSLLSGDADFAFQMMVARAEELAAEGPLVEDRDPWLSSLLSVGLGGYAWRAAEEAAERGIGSEIIEGVREAIGSVVIADEQLVSLEATAEQVVLYQASARVIAQAVPLWYTMPGYRGSGGVLYGAGLRYVSDRVAHSEPPPSEEDIFYAFAFGVALRHVEEQLGDVETPQPGAWTGPDWEVCEIELRRDGRVFLGIVESAGERHVVAESRRLPANRHPLPVSIDRRPSRIMDRHAELVEELRRQDGCPLSGTAVNGGRTASVGLSLGKAPEVGSRLEAVSETGTAGARDRHAARSR